MRRLSSLCLVAVLGACSGNSGHALPTVVAPQPSTKSAATAIVHFSIVVPAGSTTQLRGARTSRPRRAAISPGGRSVVVTLTAANGAAISASPTLIALGTGVANCAPSAAGITCTGSLPGVVGSDTFSIAEFATVDGTGTPLATTAVTITVRAAGGNLALQNSATISLDAVASNIVITTNPQSLTAGTAAPFTLAATPVNAAGIPLLIPGADLTLLVAGGTNAFLFPVKGGAPVPPDGSPLDEGTAIGVPLSAAYNGTLDVLGSYAVTATLSSPGGAPLTSTGAITFSNVPTPPAPSQQPKRLVVLDAPTDGATDASLFIYALTANGNVAPLRRIDLGTPAMPAGGNAVTVEPSGEIDVGLVAPQAEILRIAPGASAPSANPLSLNATSSSFSTALFPSQPVNGGFVAVGAGDTLLATGTSKVSGLSGLPGVLRFRPLANGSDEPVDAFKNYDETAANLALGTNINPVASAIAGTTDEAGRSYLVLDNSDDAYAPYGAGAYSNATTIAVTGADASGPRTATVASVSNPTLALHPARYVALAVDPAGLVYALTTTATIAALGLGAGANPEPGEIDVYAPITAASNGNRPIRSLTSTRILTGPTVTTGGLGYPSAGLAADGTRIFVADPVSKSIVVFADAAAGANPTPIATVAGSMTGLSNPVSLAIGPVGP